MIVPMYFFVEEDGATLNGPWVTSEDAVEAGKLYGKFLNFGDLSITGKDRAKVEELQRKAYDLGVALKKVAEGTDYYDPANIEILRLLSNERKDNEGVMETLTRIINERNAAREYVERDQQILPL